MVLVTMLALVLSPRPKIVLILVTVSKIVLVLVKVLRPKTVVEFVT